MTNDDLPELFQFLGACFHEDWMCESALADDIIKSFIADSEKATLLNVVKEIEALLALNLTENDLRNFLLKEIGCCYCYWHEWPNGNEWLEHVKFLLEKQE